MLTLFLQATEALLGNLLGDVYSGSLMPAIDGATGSLVAAVGLS